MANFILLTQGTGGDLHPFIQISLGLLRRGHTVTLYTQTCFGEEITRYGIDFVPVDAPLSPEQKNLSELAAQAQGLPASGGMSPQIWATCLNVFESIKERNIPGQTTLVSNYNLNLVCQNMAEALGMSFVEIYPAPYFVMKMGVVHHMYTHDSDLFNRYRAEMDLPAIDDWRAWLHSQPHKLGLWPEWFAPNDPNWIFRVTPVGFVWNVEFETGELPEQVRQFLADGEPPVLITHGTSEPFKPEFFSASVEACRSLGRKALLVTKFEELVPADLPSCVKWFDYVPFASLLPHISAIIHHGGIGTLNQSLAAGVPQLVLGYGHDRPDNGMRIQRLGAGSYLPSVRWRSDVVTDALSRVTSADVYERCRKLAQRMKNTADPADVVCDALLNLPRTSEPEPDAELMMSVEL